MGIVESKGGNAIVMPEILCFHQGRLFLVHGLEAGRDFWWPPGAYWIAEKACDLTEEQPEDWVARVLRSQVGVEPTSLRLRSVEFIASTHPPVFIYEASFEGEPKINSEYEFDQAGFFDIAEMPKNLGRDAVHGKWLEGIIAKLV